METTRKQNPPSAPSAAAPRTRAAVANPPCTPDDTPPTPASHDPPAAGPAVEPAETNTGSIYPRTRGVNNSLHRDSSSKNQETITPPPTPPETLTPDSQPREETKQAAARLLCDLAAALYGGVPRIPRQARRPLAALCLATIYAGGIPLAEQARTLPRLATQSHVSDPLRYLTGCIANRTDDRAAFLKLANTIDPRPIYPAITAEYNRRQQARLRSKGGTP